MDNESDFVAAQVDESVAPTDAVSVSARVSIMSEQLERARGILRNVEEGRLLPDERFAISQLTLVLEELTDDVHVLLIEERGL